MDIDTFIREFEPLAAAPNGVQKLRELILQLAVRGKLVPQNAMDAPALELLKNSQAEKKMLQDARKFNTTAMDSTHYLKREERIPLGWQECQIGDICELKTGATPRRNNPAYFDGNIKWLVSGDIHKKEILECSGRISELGLNNSNCKILPNNCVLIALTECVNDFETPPIRI